MEREEVERENEEERDSLSVEPKHSCIWLIVKSLLSVAPPQDEYVRN